MLIFTEYFRAAVCADWDRKPGAHLGRRQRQKSEDRGTGRHDAVVQEHVQQDAQNRPAFRRYDTRWNYRLSIKQSDEGERKGGGMLPFMLRWVAIDKQNRRNTQKVESREREDGKWRRKKKMEKEAFGYSISCYYYFRVVMVTGGYSFECETTCTALISLCQLSSVPTLIICSCLWETRSMLLLLPLLATLCQYFATVFLSFISLPSLDSVLFLHLLSSPAGSFLHFSFLLDNFARWSTCLLSLQCIFLHFNQK